VISRDLLFSYSAILEITILNSLIVNVIFFEIYWRYGGVFVAGGESHNLT